MYQILKQAYEQGKVLSVYINESDPTSDLNPKS